jgi:hypothetical protein
MQLCTLAPALLSALRCVLGAGLALGVALFVVSVLLYKMLFIHI